VDTKQRTVKATKGLPGLQMHVVLAMPSCLPALCRASFLPAFLLCSLPSCPHSFLPTLTPGFLPFVISPVPSFRCYSRVSRFVHLYLPCQAQRIECLPRGWSLISMATMGYTLFKHASQACCNGLMKSQPPSPQ
jgi:hypothetical protein